MKDNQGQMIITAGQIVWTHECERALSDGDNARKSVKLLKKKWISYLNKLVAITRSKLNKIERNKVRLAPLVSRKGTQVLPAIAACNCARC